MKRSNIAHRFALLALIFAGAAALAGTLSALAAVPEAPRQGAEDTGTFQKCCSWLDTTVTNLKEGTSALVEKTQSPIIRLLFIYLLGILMSLTPCIYPMIPITVGILQTTAGSSLLRNFALAGSYTLGIAMTFASLGFLAAVGSAQFGMLLGNPYFVLFLVLFLGYMAFSMMGLYDIYVPRFLQAADGEPSARGSFISAFIFGVVSGTVASPCLSPGLVLLLSIVATLGSKLLGFTYLFIFGIGLGTPLLIIGTFSNSMNMLPRAGSWMMEVKKLFGLMLLSMSLYYVSNITPLWWVLLLSGAIALICAYLYAREARTAYSQKIAIYQWLVAGVLIIASAFLMLGAFRAFVGREKPAQCPQVHPCITYHDAREKALQEHKLLLVDFGAAWCSSCRTFERTILNNPEVIEKLPRVIIVSVDCTNPQESVCAELQERFKVIGFPTVLLVDPANESVKGHWAGELAEMTPERFVALIHQHS